MAEQILDPNSIHSNKSFPGGKEYRCIDYKAGTPLVVDCVTAPAANKTAARWIDRNRVESEPFAACYVIACPALGRTKIGFSRNPDVRLRGIAQQCPDDVELVALFWSFEHQAHLIEGYSLQLAKKRGVRSRGEWVTLNGRDTAALVVDACRYEVPYTDSSTFMDSWIAREAPTDYLASDHAKGLWDGSKPLRDFLRF